MELRTLKYFLAIAREENMTNAANILHVSQSALSRQMQDLEAHLGKTLFLRSSRKMLLTEDGMQLKKRAEEILSLVERTEMEFQSTDSDVYGEIHIGAGETQIMRHVSLAIGRLRKKHPMIKYHLYSGNANDVMDKLEKGVLDFGLLFEPVPKEKFEYLTVPDSDITGVLVKRDGPYGKLSAITPALIKEMPLLVSSRLTDESTLLYQWLGCKLSKLNIIATFNLLYNASIMVQNDIGNVLTIGGLINTKGTNLRFIPLEPGIERNLVFVWKKYQIISTVQKLFIEEIRKVFQ